jgi:hypothetical protein
MNHRATPRFWACYRAFRTNSNGWLIEAMNCSGMTDPSLHLKQVGLLWAHIFRKKPDRQQYLRTLLESTDNPGAFLKAREP